MVNMGSLASLDPVQESNKMMMQEQDYGSELVETKLKLGLAHISPRVFLKHIENSNFFFLVSLLCSC